MDAGPYGRRRPRVAFRRLVGMTAHPRSHWRALVLLAVMSLVLALPASVVAHAELGTSDPADGATVEAPFAGPILLTFSEALATGSGAQLRDSAGQVAATSTVDGAIVTLTPASALAEGEYEVQWTARADDGHIERGTIRFVVATAATPTPTPTPTATPTPEPSEAVPATPEPSAGTTGAPSAAATPAASGGPDAGTASSDMDVVLPIILGAILVAALGAFLLRRRDSDRTPS